MSNVINEVCRFSNISSLIKLKSRDWIFNPIPRTLPIWSHSWAAGNHLRRPQPVHHCIPRLMDMKNKKLEFSSPFQFSPNPVLVGNETYINRLLLMRAVDWCWFQLISWWPDSDQMVVDWPESFKHSLYPLLKPNQTFIRPKILEFRGSRYLEFGLNSIHRSFWPASWSTSLHVGLALLLSMS